MSHDLAFHHIDDQFADIGGVIRDPLDIFPDKGEADGPGDGGGIFDHERDEFTKELMGQIIDKVIIGADFSRQSRILPDKSIQRFTHHFIVQAAMRGRSI